MLQLIYAIIYSIYSLGKVSCIVVFQAAIVEMVVTMGVKTVAVPITGRIVKNIFTTVLVQTGSGSKRSVNTLAIYAAEAAVRLAQ